MLSTAAALAAVLIGASQVGARDAEATASASVSPAAAAPASPNRRCSPVSSSTAPALGSPKAPVTLVEYADLQCPYCAQWARDTMPSLVEDYVETGKLRIVFRGLAFIGPDSDKALRTALAAGRDDHLWDVVHGLYLNQGHENAGWVTDELVGEIAAGAGLDAACAPRRALGRLGRVADQAAPPQAAQAAGVHGTPAFQVGPTGGRLELVQVSSLGPEGIIPAIEAVLAR